MWPPSLRLLALAAFAAFAGLAPDVGRVVSPMLPSFLRHGTPSFNATAFSDQLAQQIAGAAGKFTAPPTVQGGSGPELQLLHNPHQSYNIVARKIKDAALQLQMATADQPLGFDPPAERLRQQLQVWRRRMHQLANNYQNLQPAVSDMLYSQGRVLRSLQHTYNAMLSNVELMMALDSCNSSSAQHDEAACRRHTVALLQDCRSVTVKARAKICRHEGVAQEVYQQHQHLASELDSAAESMQQASETAYQQQQVVTMEVASAQQRVAAAESRVPGGFETIVVCLIAPYLCPGILIGGAYMLAKVHHASFELQHSATLQLALRTVHAESVRAEDVTSKIREVVVEQGGWVASLVSGLGAVDEIMSDVIDITSTVSLDARTIVLRQLHRGLVELLHVVEALDDMSTSHRPGVQLASQPTPTELAVL